MCLNMVVGSRKDFGRRIYQQPGDRRLDMPIRCRGMHWR